MTHQRVTPSPPRGRHTSTDVMSAATTGAKMGTAYWRIAGMSYLKYANACGEVVRQSLKEPHLTQVRDDECTHESIDRSVEFGRGTRGRRLTVNDARRRRKRERRYITR